MVQYSLALLGAFSFLSSSAQCKSSLQPWCSKWCHWLNGPRCQTVLTASRQSPTSRYLAAHPQRHSCLMRRSEEACVFVGATWQYLEITNNGQFIQKMATLQVRNWVLLAFFSFKWKQRGWFNKVQNKPVHAKWVWVSVGVVGSSVVGDLLRLHMQLPTCAKVGEPMKT